MSLPPSNLHTPWIERSPLKTREKRQAKLSAAKRIAGPEYRGPRGDSPNPSCHGGGFPPLLPWHAAQTAIANKHTAQKQRRHHARAARRPFLLLPHTRRLDTQFRSSLLSPTTWFQFFALAKLRRTSRFSKGRHKHTRAPPTKRFAPGPGGGRGKPHRSRLKFAFCDTVFFGTLAACVVVGPRTPIASHPACHTAYASQRDARKAKRA